MSSTSRAERPRSKRAPSGTKVAGSEVSVLEAHLGYWLRLVSNHVSHAFKTKVERHGVTVAEWVVLRALFESDGIKPSVLSAQLGLSRGTISKLVDRLATKELVKVSGDARDGRAQIVSLCAAGRRIVPKLALLADVNDAEAFGHLADEQRTLLLSTLKSLVDHLELRGAPID